MTYYNGNGEIIRNPNAYFKACGEEKYDIYIDSIADEVDFAAGQVSQYERDQKLASAGFSSEEDYSEAYYAVECSDLGEPASQPWFDDDF